jgi:tetratricopeptide (TPR) repeat protein
MVFESAHIVFKSTFGERSTEYANFLYDYAALMTEQASYDSAITIADKTKALRIQLYGEDHPMTAQVIWLIALINKKRGNFAAAILAYQKAIEVRIQIILSLQLFSLLTCYQ